MNDCPKDTQTSNMHTFAEPLRDRSKPTQDEKWEQPSKARGPRAAEG